MNVGSVCSGVGTCRLASAGLGWRHAFFSEVDPFASALLAHRFPDVPNLGDMMEIRADAGPVDILVGGTPCQSFSVAGLRAGLADPRGNLALGFLRLAQDLRARWVVWENVPGVLSSNGGRDFVQILDGLEELGYIVDVEILDAKDFGVPQRRRRLFICARSITDLLKKRTTSSEAIIAKCLLEILLGILEGRVPIASESERNIWGFLPAGFRSGGALRRMKLFGISTGTERDWKTLLGHLENQQPRVRRGPSASDSIGGAAVADYTQGDLFLDSETAPRFTCTERSLHRCLEDAYDLMRSFTTSTSTSWTTDQTTLLFWTGLLIAERIRALSASSPSWFDAASSALTFLQASTIYARQSVRAQAVGVEWVRFWGSFREQAEICERELVGHLGGWAGPGAVLFEPESLPGDSASGAGSGARVAARAGGGPGEGRGGETAVFVTDDPAKCLNAHGSRRYDSSGETFVMTPRVPRGPRRLTPRECERLQGLPDDWTLVPYRGKPAADGPRYRVIGNGWALPVARWVFERIDAVDALRNPR